MFYSLNNKSPSHRVGEQRHHPQTHVWLLPENKQQQQHERSRIQDWKAAKDDGYLPWLFIVILLLNVKANVSTRPPPLPPQKLRSTLLFCITRIDSNPSYSLPANANIRQRPTHNCPANLRGNRGSIHAALRISATITALFARYEYGARRCVVLRLGA